MPDTNPRKQIATKEVFQRTKKTSRRKKASEVWGLWVHTTRMENGIPATLATNWKQRFDVDGVESGEAAKDKIFALQRLAKEWSANDLTIYTDGTATNGTAIGGGGILVTARHPSNPAIQHFMPYRSAYGARPFKLK